MEANLKIINQLDDFKTLIDSGKAILVDFHATWCGPCKSLTPRIEELSKEFKNVVFVKVDVDEAPEITEEYQVSAMPTVMGFHAGIKIEVIIGFNNAKITELVEKLSDLSGPIPENQTNPVISEIQTEETEDEVPVEELKTSISSNEEIGGENMNHVYLEAKFSEFIPDFKKITVMVCTHDQGFASVEESNSFFDLHIVDKKGNLLAEKSRIIENYKEGDYTNKLYELSRDDLELGKFMVKGNVLQLVVRSQYAGWENHVCEGELIFE